jgi:hypothetical protein
LNQNVRLAIEGFCHADTIIDYRNCNGPWLITDRAIRWLEISNLKGIGRGEFFRQYSVAPIAPSTVIPNNTGGYWTVKVHDCIFDVTDGTAFSVQTPDSPHQLYERNLFIGRGNNARGIVVRGNPTNVVIRNNVFGNHVYSIALACDGGGYFNFESNEFFKFDPRPAGVSHHYWILPGTAAGGDGRGGRIIYNKQGNENSIREDVIILFADANTYDLTTANHLTTRSTGRLTEMEVYKEQIATYSINTPAIISYTPNITNCQFKVNKINNNRPVIGSGLAAPVPPATAGVKVLTAAEEAALVAQVVA